MNVLVIVCHCLVTMVIAMPSLMERQVALQGEVLECIEENQPLWDYRGTQNYTETGTACESWDNPQHVINLQTNPNDGLDGNNYCRSPDNDPDGTWCYVSPADPDVTWGYCDVPMCGKVLECIEDNLPLKDYRGTQNYTVTGTACQRWDVHGHVVNPQTHPNGGLEGNSCRSPDSNPNGTWCYALPPDHPDVTWEYCDVPTCGTDADPAAESACILKDQDYEGADIYDTNTISTMSRCIEECLVQTAMDTCAAIVWRESTKTCWFKISVPVLKKYIGRDSVNMTCMRAQHPEPSTPEVPVTESACILKDQNYEGADIYDTTTMSTMSRCIEECLAETAMETCAAIVWRQSTQTCWFKISVPVLKSYIGRDSVNMTCIRAQNPYLTECDAGEYKSANGLCEICPNNTYSGAGASNCTQCPDNTLSEKGSTSIADCLFDCTACKPELNEVCQNEECTCSSCDVRGMHGICVKSYQIEYITLRLYDDAQLQCKSRGLDLAMINSDEDNSAFIHAVKLIFGDSRENSTYNTANWIWIGATYLAIEGEYQFRNGDRLNFSAPWADKQPDHRPIGGLVAAPCILRNQEYQGSDIHHNIGLSTLAQCINDCLSLNGTISCEAVVWRQSTKTCSLKSSVPTLSASVGVDSVDMTCIRSQPLATSMEEDQRHVAVSRWGEWDDSFGNYWLRAFACSC